MPYLDAPVREHTTLEGALDAIFDKLDSLDGMSERVDGMSERMDGMSERMDGMSERVDGMSERVDGMSEKLDSLDTYARNHMTSKMDNGFGEVAARFDRVDTDLENIRNDVAIAKNLFQDHDH